MNHDQFLSRAAGRMTQSAIRKMGTILAAGRDIISFAPGYPAPETFPWDEFRAIASELLASRDGAVLQYGATRGYRPLLESIEFLRQYSGEQTGEGRKSVSFRLTVGSAERTLSSEEVSEIRQRIIDGMRALGYELRV